MINKIRVGIIHAYPSAYILDSLASLNVNVVLFGPKSSDFKHENLEDTIECSLHDWSLLEKSITDYHAKMPFCALLPIYEGAVEITAVIAKKIGVFGIDIQTAKASRNKFLSWKTWNEYGLPVPHTVDITSIDEALNRVKNEINFPVVLKLADSMNSQGVILAHNEEEFNTALMQLNGLIDRPMDLNLEVDRNRNAYARSEIRIIAQEFCDGAEVSVDVLCNNTYQIVGIFEKSISKGPYFAETMSVHPSSLGKERDQELSMLAIEALKAIGFNQGVAHVEIRYSSEGPKVLEAGLRPGGAYTVMAIEHLLNINLYRMLLSIHLNLPLESIDRNPEASLYGGIVYKNSGILKSVHGLDIFDKIPGLLDVKVLNQEGDLVFGLPNSAQPHFCYYLLGGKSREDVIELHEKIKRSIHLEIAPIEVI